jgi:hypothetical protein
MNLPHSTAKNGTRLEPAVGLGPSGFASAWLSLGVWDAFSERQIPSVTA